MRFYRKYKEASKSEQISVSDRAARTIVQVVSKIQNGFVAVMNKALGHMAPKKLKVGLVLFCSLSGGLSIYLLVDPIMSPLNRQKNIKVDQLNIPKHIQDASDNRMASDIYVDEETFRRIISFKLYMDSIKIHERAKYDSIILGRPKLMDSVTILEQLYYLQTQNKKYEK